MSTEFAPRGTIKVAPLYVLALCTLRTNYPRHWYSLLIRSGLDRRWIVDQPLNKCSVGNHYTVDAVIGAPSGGWEFDFRPSELNHTKSKRTEACRKHWLEEYGDNVVLIHGYDWIPSSNPIYTDRGYYRTTYRTARAKKIKLKNNSFWFRGDAKPFVTRRDLASERPDRVSEAPQSF